MEFSCLFFISRVGQVQLEREEIVYRRWAGVLDLDEFIEYEVGEMNKVVQGSDVILDEITQHGR